MLELEKEWPLSDGAVMMVRHGLRICAADANEYKLIFLDTGDSVPLFPYDRNLQKPVAAVYNEGEFLLVTATPQGLGLGVFISQNGEPIRGTLEWSAIPRSLAFHFPYVAALLSSGKIEVHNVINQQRVQTLILPSGMRSHVMEEATFDLELSADAAGTIKILVAGANSVIGLKMMPLRQQVDELLLAERVEQAIELGEHIMMSGGDSAESNAAQLKKLYERAGMVYFRKTMFDNALEQFKRARIDPDVLTALFPGMGRVRPPEEDEPELETPSEETLDTVVNLFLEKEYGSETSQTALLKGVLVENAKTMIGSYLRHVRDNCSQEDVRRERIDMCLLRIYLTMDSSVLHAFLLEDHAFELEPAKELLVEAERYFALNVLLQSCGRLADVVEIYRRLAIGEVTDPDYPGVDSVIELLRHLDDATLVLEATTWLLNIDLPLTVEFLIDRIDNLYSKEEVATQLRNHSKAAYIMFLERMAKDLDAKNAAYHTELAILYIDRVGELGDDDAFHKTEELYHNTEPRPTFETYLSRNDDPLSSARVALLAFIHSSTLWDASTVLEKLRDWKYLRSEQALALAKTGEDERVLALYLDMRDYVSAETYCMQKPIDLRTPLLTRLLHFYLEAGDTMALPARRLMKKHHRTLDLIDVLEAIPDAWSVIFVSEFLVSSMRATRHEYNTGRVVRALARGENFKAQARLVHQQTHNIEPIIISNMGAQCAVCGRVIADPTVFMRFPSGQLAHLHCGKETKSAAL
ncbi:transforming growth factor, beta receptor associated protein 1 [Thoreauomyces humboldtii]|nr:transforming growth factor, beta receptor associated protein 1 [Thoreauomyces humboldtii]